MNAEAAAFKNGFGTQFMQPFPDTESIYSPYSYNNWATKVPSPLGPKSFQWGPLASVVPTNHQNTANCFNTGSSSVTVSMGSGSMLGSGMGGSLTVATPGNGVAAPPCPYTTPTNPYTMYRASEPCSASSIASLRLKAKQHASGFTSPYSTPSPVSRSNSSGLSACQYASVSDSV